ncbi:hypothetical protein Tel_07215 [Candidatus Tenderia electrophaga]|jgi:hypothetical protein|uniref:Uncharacterized protein n=1 Tax=Candidatus Tenderia electrophaga TaxID=1748243 RepID=A0A0S2TCS4_9GAMM|nr:hypothetical protein Tel_07215 [Candidatus Tenderia electrophaga]
MRKTHPIFIGCLLSAAVLATPAAQAAGPGKTYKVSVTNLTPGQPFAPTMAAVHRNGLAFFAAGQAPSDELAMLAEAGNGQPMAAKLMSMDAVSDAQVSTMGMTFPGQSTSVMVKAKHGANSISVAAMLGATNDAFFAIKDLPLPRGRHSVTYFANAYDAGSETNDELSSTVAGLGGEGYSPNDSGEGFVHIHSGVHGIGDLVAATMDWRNPVAKIVVERVRD